MKRVGWGRSRRGVKKSTVHYFYVYMVVDMFFSSSVFLTCSGDQRCRAMDARLGMSRVAASRAAERARAWAPGAAA